MAKPGRDLGQEILQGILELKRGRTGRVTRVPMHNPPHPGEIIKSLYLEPLGLTTWLNTQLQHDLWHAEAQRKKLRVMKLAA
jgi:hypothetical protein